MAQPQTAEDLLAKLNKELDAALAQADALDEGTTSLTQRLEATAPPPSLCTPRRAHDVHRARGLLLDGTAAQQQHAARRAAARQAAKAAAATPAPGQYDPNFDVGRRRAPVARIHHPDGGSRGRQQRARGSRRRHRAQAGSPSSATTSSSVSSSARGSRGGAGRQRQGQGQGQRQQQQQQQQRQLELDLDKAYRAVKPRAPAAVIPPPKSCTSEDGSSSLRTSTRGVVRWYAHAV